MRGVPCVTEDANDYLGVALTLSLISTVIGVCSIIYVLNDDSLGLFSKGFFVGAMLFVILCHWILVSEMVKLREYARSVCGGG